MKANFTSLQKIARNRLKPGETLPFALYLYLPRNDRIVLIRRQGEILDPAMHERLQSYPSCELWSGPDVEDESDLRAAFEAGRELEAKATLDASEAQADFTDPAGLREAAEAGVHGLAQNDPVLAEVLAFRASQPPRAHSVLVGSLSVALARAAGVREPERLAHLLVAATFHDLALPLGAEAHEAAAVNLIAESDARLAPEALEAIRGHHEEGTAGEVSLRRFLSLAERNVDASPERWQELAATVAAVDSRLARGAA